MRRITSFLLVTFFYINMIHTVKADGTEDSINTPPAIDTAALITIDQLSQVATNCRQDVMQAHQYKNQISKDKLREYSIALGIAAEKCEALTKVFLEVQKASQDFNIYTQNLQHAQSYGGNMTEFQGSHAPESNGFVIHDHSHKMPANSFPHENSVMQESLPAENTEPVDLH